jgi:hypothetical protein
MFTEPAAPHSTRAANATNPLFALIRLYPSFHLSTAEARLLSEAINKSNQRVGALACNLHQVNNDNRPFFGRALKF